MTRASAALFLSGLLSGPCLAATAGPAHADELAEGLTRPRAGVRRGASPPLREARSRDEQEPGPEAEPWGGPAVQLGYSRYVLEDGEGGGQVQGVTLGGFFPTGAVRSGVTGEFARRGYSLASDDVLVRGALHLGYQQLDGLGPFHPYVSLVATYGWVLGKRFHTPVSDALSGGGFELGADLVLVRALHVGVAYSFLRARHRGLGHGLHLLRVTLGL